MGYCFKDGKVVHFQAHMYATSSKSEIAELTTECENAHPNFYIDSAQKTVAPDYLDPIATLRATIRAEELAKIAAMGNPLRDMGSTPQGKLEGIANSHSIAGLQAASEAQAQAAQTVIPPANVINKPIVLAQKTK
jgi:hypothetical protein